MGIREPKPVTPGMRHHVASDFAELTGGRPPRRLLEPLPKTGGRNAHGHIASRFRGGGHKRLYRRIDFYRRDKANMEATVLAVHYDPNRNARIALLEYADKERRYILWPEGLRPGERVMAGEQAEVKSGNAMPLRAIPTGQPIHNVELFPNRGGQVVRSGGSAATIQAKEGDVAHVRLPSGEIRLIPIECWATIGQLGNADAKSLILGKAGRRRWLGRKPHVRGVAMNPVDHPHGGGEGKSGQGNPHPVSPWGWHTKGRKTRRRTKYSDRWVVARRP
jgi:large subunit ribosomal protein L2